MYPCITCGGGDLWISLSNLRSIYTHTSETSTLDKTERPMAIPQGPHSALHVPVSELAATDKSMCHRGVYLWNLLST